MSDEYEYFWVKHFVGYITDAMLYCIQTHVM